MKNITFRHYTAVPGITDDYYKVRDFLIERGHCEFTYARWDWMITHYLYLDKKSISKIGIWENCGRAVALALFDCEPAETFLLALPGYESLYEQMLDYAEKELNVNDRFGIVIADTNAALQDSAAEKGFFASGGKECDAIFYPQKTSLSYSLPEGFKLTDMAESYDLYQYGRILHRGFGSAVEIAQEYVMPNETRDIFEGEMRRPNVDLKLKLAAVAPNGNFCSYCGMWYDKNAGYAVIEPVATDPDYRKLGLGKAVVLEGIKRVYEMGAKYVLVGSSQQFYYSIGLRPYASCTKWIKK